MALIKDVDSILKGRKIKVRKAGEKFEHTSLMPDDEWYPKAVRTKIRPARWNWKDCHAKLQGDRELADSGRRPAFHHPRQQRHGGDGQHRARRADRHDDPQSG